MRNAAVTRKTVETDVTLRLELDGSGEADVQTGCGFLNHMAGGSAALSIVTGEAARYDREMTVRETLLNDSNQPVVTLAPLTATPAVLMEDLLAPGSAYDVRPTLCAYYHKTAVLVEGGAQP